MPKWGNRQVSFITLTRDEGFNEKGPVETWSPPWKAGRLTFLRDEGKIFLDWGEKGSEERIPFIHKA